MNLRPPTHPYILSLILSIMIAFSVQGQMFPPLELTFSSGQGVKGSIVCLDVTVKNFTDIESFQFNISYNAALVRPICPPDSIHYIIPEGSPYMINCGSSDQGYINLIWASNPGTLTDGTVLMTLCFQLIGDPGNISPVYVNGLITEVEINRADGMGNSKTIDLISNPGSITIISNTLEIYARKCDTDANTAGSKTGSLSFYAVGGKPPYSYTVNGGAYTGNITKDGDRIKISNLPSGNYSITITDANNLQISKNINISSNLPIIIDTPIVKDPTCIGYRNGSIQIPSIAGGLPPFEYLWSNYLYGSLDDPSQPLSLNMLDAGKYFLTLTDGSGCEVVDSFELHVDTLKAKISVLDSATCKTSKNGKLRIEIEGGKPYVGTSGDEYSYRINSGSWVRITPVVDLTNIPAGPFTINVQDANACHIGDQSYFMPYKADSLTFEILDKRDVSCFGLKDGYLEVRALPSGMYAYGGDLLGISTSGKLIVNNIAPGNNYLITAFDANQCKGSMRVNISEPAKLDVKAMVVQPDCTTSGYIKLLDSGGTMPYTITWDPVQGTNIDSIGNITGGTYSVTIADKNNCPPATKTFVMNQQGALSISAVLDKPISCDGANDAQISVDINSVNSPFDIVWRNELNQVVGTTKTLSNLSPGTYSVIVKDNTGCQSLADTVVVEPKAAVEVMAQVEDALCYGGEGTINISLNVDSTTVKLEWRKRGNATVLNTTSIFKGTSGDYTLTVIGPGTCIKDFDYTLSQGQPISFETPASQPVKCFGMNNGTALIFNSPLNLYYYWSSGELDGPLAIKLPAGENWVYAEDENGCLSDTVFFNVDNIAPLTFDNAASEIINPSCYGYNNGSILVKAQGGSGSGYVYNWITEAVITPFLQNKGVGEYIVEVTDSKSCVHRDTFYLTQPDSLIAYIDKNQSIELDCNNTDQGVIVLSTSGGNEGIKTYAWDNSIATTGNTISNLSQGTYCATVTDLKGCSAKICHTLTAPAQLVGSLNPTPEPVCNGGTTCISVNNITGGTGNYYTFQINNGVRYPLDSCVQVQAGLYIVNLIDSAGCYIDTVITINQPLPVSVDAGPDISIQLGTSSDVINTIIDSPIAINSIQWSPEETIDCVTSDCRSVVFNPSKTTTYTIIATDENGCLGRDDIEVKVKNIRHAYFANIFTPNSDGENDYFQIKVGPGVEIIKDFQIYDRWGSKVWHQANYLPDPSGTDGWDGRFQGVPVDPGVFVYIATVRFIDGQEIQYRGDITVLNKSYNK